MAKRPSSLNRSALACLLAPSEHDILVAAHLLASDSPTPCVSGLGTFAAVESRELASTLRRHRGRCRVLITDEVDPTLARAIADEPPALMVVTGRDTGNVERTDLTSMLVLGPHAELHVGAGNQVACAQAAGELRGLRRTLTSLRLAVAPTPTWLWQWLDDDLLKDATAIGYVPSEALRSAWATWFVQANPRHVLVPVGVTSDQVAEALDKNLEALVAAHTLERWTGPVFPAPRVLALVGGQDDEQLRDVADEARAVWRQARRALPYTGAALGMTDPDPHLPLDAPAAAFLAQRPRLRRAARGDLVAKTPTWTTDLPEDGVDRALEVLRASGEHLSEHESKVVLHGFGLDTTRQAVASSASGAANYADLVGYPVVLKAVGPEVVDKTKLGLIELDLTNAAAVKRSYTRITAQVEEELPTVALDGVLVSEMAAPGLDIHCGIRRLANHEQVAIFGRAVGQVFPLEATYALAPLDVSAALLLADGILARVPAPALRRASDPQVETLARVLLRISELVRLTEDRLISVDLDPIRLLPGERPHLVLDARITQRAHLEGL